MPDEVIDAISAYLRESNANVGGPFETSRAHRARRRCGARSRRPLPRLLARRGDVRREHDLAVVRALAHRRRAASRPETRSSSRASTTTATSRRGSSWPTTSASTSASPTSPTTATSTSPTSSGSSPTRTRVVAFPVASNAVGTLTDVARIVELAHGAGALAWADAVHAAPHVPTDVAAWGVDVLLCSPYKFFGPHLGVAYVRREVAEGVAAVQGATAGGRAARPPLRDGDAAVRAARRLRRRGRVRRVDRLDGDPGARAVARRAVPRRACRTA